MSFSSETRLPIVLPQNVWCGVLHLLGEASREKHRTSKEAWTAPTIVNDAIMNACADAEMGMVGITLMPEALGTIERSLRIAERQISRSIDQQTDCGRKKGDQEVVAEMQASLTGIRDGLSALQAANGQAETKRPPIQVVGPYATTTVSDGQLTAMVRDLMEADSESDLVLPHGMTEETVIATAVGILRTRLKARTSAFSASTPVHDVVENQIWPDVRWSLSSIGALFDPSKVRIERKRFSVTQGEVEVFYGERRLEQWGDEIALIGTCEPGREPLGVKLIEHPEPGAVVIGGWAGRGDDYWISVARRCLAPG